MGSTFSRALDSPQAAETKSLEARLASLGDLPDLQLVFSHLSASAPSTQKGAIPPLALQECFELQAHYTGCPSSSELSMLKPEVGPTLVDIVFEPDDGGIDWTGFLKGFEKYCRQNGGSIKLKFLLFYFYHIRKRAELPLSFSFTNKDGAFSHHNEIVGHMTSGQFQDFLWLCWLMTHQANRELENQMLMQLPDVEPLVRAACVACSVNEKNKQNMGQFLDRELSVAKLYSWMVSSIAGLSDSISEYIQAHLHKAASNLQDQSKAQNVGGRGDGVNSEMCRSTVAISEVGLLTSGVAWASGLSQTDAHGSKLIMSSFAFEGDFASLLYRSSLHGRGMNRFWTHVEGYRGTVLMLIVGTSLPNTEGFMTENLGEDKWLVGAVVRSGFENKDSYYGNPGGCLLALDPVFLPLRCTGKCSNYVYSYTAAAGSVYPGQQQKKPDGIAFGGDIGKERLWLDEDFASLTVRHHAVDRTYQPGRLISNQEYAPFKGKVLDVEVWGLGGRAVKEQQEKFQKRESLFSEQKRKVDLKSFGNWADSPEKMMMDMVSDPSKVQREER